MKRPDRKFMMGAAALAAALCAAPPKASVGLEERLDYGGERVTASKPAPLRPVALRGGS